MFPFSFLVCFLVFPFLIIVRWLWLCQKRRTFYSICKIALSALRIVLLVQPFWLYCQIILVVNRLSLLTLLSAIIYFSLLCPIQFTSAYFGSPLNHPCSFVCLLLYMTCFSLKCAFWCALYEFLICTSNCHWLPFYLLLGLPFLFSLCAFCCALSDSTVWFFLFVHQIIFVDSLSSICFALFIYPSVLFCVPFLIFL